MTQPGDADEATPTDEQPADAAEQTTAEETTAEEEQAAADEQVTVDAFDLDGDGKVSLTEDWRAEIGIVDARAEELADKPGVKGKVARAVHRLLDKFDND
jgi:hypothetical protein